MNTPNHPFWKITSNGKPFDFLHPQPNMIDRDMIAQELSMINRWNGNLHFPYSVAQHSLLVADLIPVPEWRIYGLLHDAAEAVIGDIDSPLKNLIQTGGAQKSGFDIKGLERRIMMCVHMHFGLANPSLYMAEAVHHADQVALATEYRDVVKGTNKMWKPVEHPHYRVLKSKPAIDVQCRFLEMLDQYLGIYRSVHGAEKGAA